MLHTKEIDPNYGVPMRLVVAVCLIPIVLSCRPKSGSSEVKHDLGRALNDTTAYQWFDATDDQFFTAAGPTLDRKLVLPFSDPAVQRVNFWISKVDTMLPAMQGPASSL
jgi:hypothetical protein